MKTIKVSEKIEEMHRIKENIYIFVMHKMFEISADTFCQKCLQRNRRRKKIVAKK